MEKRVNFPLRLPLELHDILHKAAFVTGRSKHQYCLEAIRKEAERDAQSIQISPVPNQGTEGETE